MIELPIDPQAGVNTLNGI